MTLIERLIELSNAWAKANERSVATLSSRVARDGKMFDRIASGGSCNVATLERFFAFFRDASNWPGGDTPEIVGRLLDGVDLSAWDSADASVATVDAASFERSAA